MIKRKMGKSIFVEGRNANSKPRGTGTGSTRLNISNRAFGIYNSRQRAALHAAATQGAPAPAGSVGKL